MRASKGRVPIYEKQVAQQQEQVKLLLAVAPLGAKKAVGAAKKINGNLWEKRGVDLLQRSSQIIMPFKPFLAMLRYLGLT